MAQARRPRGGCALRKMHRRFASTLGNECAPYLSPRHRDRRPRHQIATEPDRLSETSFGSRSDRNLQHAIALVSKGIVRPSELSGAAVTAAVTAAPLFSYHVGAYGATP